MAIAPALPTGVTTMANIKGQVSRERERKKKIMALSLEEGNEEAGYLTCCCTSVELLATEHR